MKLSRPLLSWVRWICVSAVATAALHAADVPRPLPRITFKTATGATIDLAAYTGQVLGVEFLNTTCPHCQRCSRILERLQHDYGPRGFQAIGIAFNEMAHMLIDDYRKNFGITFPIGWSTREPVHEFLQHPTMLIMYVPQVVFVDRRGVIRAQHGGTDPFFQNEEKNMRDRIVALLDEPAAKPASGGKKGGKSIKKAAD